MSVENENALALAGRVAQAIADAHAQVRAIRAPTWELTSNARWQDQACGYCGEKLDPSRARTRALDLIVPLAHGGSRSRDNQVLACKQCSMSKAGNDLLSWSKLDALPAPDELKARRLAALESAENHLTDQWAGIPKARLLDALRERWQHPRVRVYALHSAGRSFIGWKSFRGSRGAPADFGVVRILTTSPHGGRLEMDAPATVYSVPESAFLDLVWQLIAANALVVPLDLDAPPATSDPSDWRHCWTQRFDDLGGLQRRRGWGGGNPPAPWKPKPLSSGRAAVRQRIRDRRRAMEKARQQARQEWDDYFFVMIDKRHTDDELLLRIAGRARRFQARADEIAGQLEGDERLLAEG